MLPLTGKRYGDIVPPGAFLSWERFTWGAAVDLAGYAALLHHCAVIQLSQYHTIFSRPPFSIVFSTKKATKAYFSNKK